jgi:PadR family transcriptional regulator PadR
MYQDQVMRRTPTTLAVAAEIMAEPLRPRWSYEMGLLLGIDRGSVNRVLQRMQRYGWLDDFWEHDHNVDGRPVRHLYVVNDIGRSKLPDLIGGKVLVSAG